MSAPAPAARRAPHLPRRAAEITAAAGATLLLLITVGSALAADPSASPEAGGDVRTTPAAPGLVGEPLLALAGVAVVALLAVAVTLLAATLAERRAR